MLGLLFLDFKVNLWWYVLQNMQKPVSGKLDVQLKHLEDFFMTDTISRASPTMAKCIQAVIKQKDSPY